MHDMKISVSGDYYPAAKVKLFVFTSLYLLYIEIFFF